MSSISQNKEELAQAIQAAFDKLLDDYSGIPEEYSREIGVQGKKLGQAQYKKINS